MKKRFLLLLTIFTISALVAAGGDIYAMSSPRVPGAPRLPEFPRKEGEPEPTNTPVPPVPPVEPTATPFVPTTIAASPTKAVTTPTPVPTLAAKAGVGGAAEPTIQPAAKAEVVGPGAQAQPGEVKALAAAAGEKELEILVMFAGLVSFLGGARLLWSGKKVS